MSYPVLEILAELKEKLSENGRLILQAPPGAGKSTVVPLKLLDEPWLAGKKIVMLEPRRLAARSVAMRMAEQLGEEAGGTVGYRVRFETRVSDKTRIEVVTEGILTRMIQRDNTLDGVGMLIFDEFHERSLQADLALALSLQVQQVLRSDLRLMVMSATLDGEKLSALLRAPVVTSSGRQYPVTIYYLRQDETVYLPNRVAKAVRKSFYEHSGDILVFLPGAGEIQATAEILERENLPVSLHPLYGDLPFKKQQQAIMPHPAGMRKVVLATSIAETSLTIEGISVVIDSGYARVPWFDPSSGLTRLATVRVTKDSADQRSGRAGRLGPGIAYRLWSEGTHATLISNRVPEILDADLATLILELSNWGVQNIDELVWVTLPPVGAVNQAKELLHQLDALQNGKITDRGRQMLKLPTHPRIAHMLLEAAEEPGNENAQAALATDVAALLEEKDPMPKNAGADLSLRVELLRRWRKGEKVPADQKLLERIERLAQAWRKLLSITADNSAVPDEAVGNLVMAAYPERVARQTEKHSIRYKLMNGRVARLPEHDPLHRETWLAIAELDAGSGEGKIFQAAPLNEQDLLQHATEKQAVYWDDEREMVVASLEKRIGGHLISARKLSTIPEEPKISILCNVIRERGLSYIGWSEEEQQWQARVLSLRTWRPHEPWADVSDQKLLETLESWLAPFLISVYKKIELQRLDMNSILAAILPWDLNSKLDRFAPSRLQVPSGSQIRVKYFSAGQPPVMEVRLQEIFGMTETPTVNEGRQKIILHLLSPGFKPVQITTDLKSFWSNTYSEVRKELRLRYPKHSWPEDPWTAQAVRGVKKKY